LPDVPTLRWYVPHDPYDGTPGGAWVSTAGGRPAWDRTEEGVVDGYAGGYAVVAAAVALGAVFVLTSLVANRLLRPQVMTREKLLSYECGLDPVGEGWAQTRVRYYVFAYLYVIFAVDAVYLFPWATVLDAAGFGLVTLIEMVVFIGFLAVGIAYAWRRGVLRWV
jgi:NADH-quinone oxidoreductase subunit A